MSAKDHKLLAQAIDAAIRSCALESPVLVGFFIVDADGRTSVGQIARTASSVSRAPALGAQALFTAAHLAKHALDTNGK